MENWKNTLEHAVVTPPLAAWDQIADRLDTEPAILPLPLIEGASMLKKAKIRPSMQVAEKLFRRVDILHGKDTSIIPLSGLLRKPALRWAAAASLVFVTVWWASHNSSNKRDESVMSGKVDIGNNNLPGNMEQENTDSRSNQPNKELQVNRQKNVTAFASTDASKFSGHETMGNENQSLRGNPALDLLASNGLETTVEPITLERLADELGNPIAIHSLPDDLPLDKDAFVMVEFEHGKELAISVSLLNLMNSEEAGDSQITPDGSVVLPNLQSFSQWWNTLQQAATWNTFKSGSETVAPQAYQLEYETRNHSDASILILI